MSALRALFALAVICLAMPAAAAPLEAYARAPMIEAATLSPDGSRLAVLVVDGRQRSVAVRDLATGTTTARAASADLYMGSVRWVGNEHLLIVTNENSDPIGISGGALPWRRAHVLNATTSKLVPLLLDETGTTNRVVNTPMIRTVGSQSTLFVEAMQFVERRGAAGLFRRIRRRGASAWWGPRNSACGGGLWTPMAAPWRKVVPSQT